MNVIICTPPDRPSRLTVQTVTLLGLCKQINGEWSRIWSLKSNEDPHLHFMKIQNIHQLKLLFKSSNRLRQDLQELSSHGKLILRKWIDYIPTEYRCFVCNGKLNAVSGYQSINTGKQQMKDFINSKSFQNIILSIPYSHGVVDCSIDPMNYEVKIIEINPFSKRSSAAKFSWVIDKNILYYHYDMNGFVYIKL